MSPIWFAKKVSDDLYTIEYLDTFTGTYEAIKIDLMRGKCLLLARDDDARYSGEPKPYRRNWFRLKRLLFEFVVTDGEVSELDVHEGEGVKAYKKKGERRMKKPFFLDSIRKLIFESWMKSLSKAWLSLLAILE